MKTFSKTIPIITDENEDKVFAECYDMIDNIMTIMFDYNCDEMMSFDTGEVITLRDLGRMKGILSGLPIMHIMYSTKEWI